MHNSRITGHARLYSATARYLVALFSIAFIDFIKHGFDTVNSYKLYIWYYAKRVSVYEVCFKVMGI